MNIDQAIEKLNCLKSDILKNIRHEAEYVVKEAMVNIEAIDKLIACGRIVEGGRKVV